MPFTTHKLKSSQNAKKKPPPRPPPPNFTKYKSKSSFSLNQPSQGVNLIEWSPPNSPKVERTGHFGGSVSSSFSSSTSSLASSKKSFEFEPPITNNLWPLPPPPKSMRAPINNSGNSGSSFQSYISTIASTNTSTKLTNSMNSNVPSLFGTTLGPTIIRPQGKKTQRTNDISPTSGSPPMPCIPPPSPPKEEAEIITPYAIALYDYPASQPNDLALQVSDVIILLQRINDDWLYGKVIDKEGMFPESFVDIQVPLPHEENLVTVLYDFVAQMPGDLTIKAGQKVKVTKKISDDWLLGEVNGQTGQFPSNFVNRVPKHL